MNTENKAFDIKANNFNWWATRNPKKRTEVLKIMDIPILPAALRWLANNYEISYYLYPCEYAV